MKNPLTTHVLDTATGRPAVGVPIVLERLDADGYAPVGRGLTNDDGRAGPLLDPAQFEAGVWRMSFDTNAYFEAQGTKGFYPVVRVVFQVTDPASHHHIPLLLSPFGYSTYRGS